MRALVSYGVVDLITMFAHAFKIIWSIGWNIIKTLTLAFSCLTMDFCFIFRLQKLMLLKTMVTETSRLWSYHLTIKFISVLPWTIDSVFLLTSKLILKIRVFLICHHFTTYIFVSHEIHIIKILLNICSCFLI